MNIYKVYFTNPSRRTSREIGKGRTLHQAHKIIFRFLDNHNYKSPYQRMWEDGDGIWVDVGSWSEFFCIKEEVI